MILSAGLTCCLAMKYPGAGIPAMERAAGLNDDNCYRWMGLYRNLTWTKDYMEALRQGEIGETGKGSFVKPEAMGRVPERAFFTEKESAEAVSALERAGAVIIGKTNMDEFAMGSTTETSAFGETKNPWNPGHVPGGSSGGSAAAVAAGECFYALGSDTGGSIRQPASFCGVVGMKPTYGTVSRYGLIAYGSSLDQIGPLCKDVRDCATIMEILASHDPKDSTSIKRDDTDFTGALVEDVKGLRIGIPGDYFGEGLDDEVRAAVLKAAEVLRDKGALVEEFDLSLVEYAIPAYYVIASAEASSNLSRFDGVKYGFRAKEYEGLHSMYKRSRSQGFGTEVKRRIMLGSFVLSSGYYDAYYLKALKVKALIKQAFVKSPLSYPEQNPPHTSTLRTQNDAPGNGNPD